MAITHVTYVFKAALSPLQLYFLKQNLQVKKIFIIDNACTNPSKTRQGFMYKNATNHELQIAL